MVFAGGLPEQEPQRLVDSLRLVFRRCRSLPGEDRGAVIRMYLAYTLRDAGRADVTRILQDVDCLLTGLPRSLRQASRGGGAVADLGRQKTVLEKLIGVYYGADAGSHVKADRASLIAEADGIIDAIVSGLRAIAATKSAGEESLQGLIDDIGKATLNNKKAMSEAVKESFDRLLSAIAPESLQAYVESKMKLGPFYKASLYDAFHDKYQQLEAYHAKGNLVRDFRAMYKKNLQSSLEGSESK